MASRAIVEAPHVVNGVITGFDAVHKPDRKFAVNFCGFAMNLKLVLKKRFSLLNNFIKKIKLVFILLLNVQQMKMLLNQNLVICLNMVFH